MTRSKEDAVSPVIGVILMVAVTVILAAVIAAFVFGMGSGVKSTKVVAATAQISGDNIIVTYQGGQNDADLDRGTNPPLITTATDKTGAALARAGTSAAFPAGVTVGSTETYAKGSNGGPYHVSVSARFKDNTTQVILNTDL